MPAFHDLTGKTFGRLVVLRRGRTVGKHTHWVCQCVCGVVKEFRTDHLGSGASTNCGCRYEQHGQSPAKNVSPEYRAYLRQKSWCRCPTNRHYRYYGGKGVRFLFQSFRDFLSAVGSKPSPRAWLMRISSDGDFCQENLHWVEKNKCKRRSRLVCVRTRQ